MFWKACEFDTISIHTHIKYITWQNKCPICLLERLYHLHVPGPIYLTFSTFLRFWYQKKAQNNPMGNFTGENFTEICSIWKIFVKT